MQSIKRPQAAAEVHAHRIDLEALANFPFVSSEGSVAQWRDYLQKKSMIPSVFSSSSVALDKDQFLFRSKRLSLVITPDILRVSSDSRLILKMAYIPDAGHEASGRVDQGTMKSKLDQIAKQLVVHEY